MKRTWTIIRVRVGCRALAETSSHRNAEAGDPHVLGDDQEGGVFRNSFRNATAPDDQLVGCDFGVQRALVPFRLSEFG